MVNSLPPVNSPSNLNKERTVEWFERVWNHDDQNHIRKRMVPDVTFELPEIKGDGIDAFIEFQTMFRGIFEGVWIDVIEVQGNGSEIEGTGNLTAIHRETRKPVDLDFTISFTWCDGKIVECRSVLEVDKLMEQAYVDDADGDSKASRAEDTLD